jgi:outer membrane biogenesis lipoprotein LolB
MRIVVATFSILFATLLLAACASDPTASLPQDAVPVTHTESNGDVITEYRVAGTLKMVKVQPFRGPTYYVQDRDGDGKLDWQKDEAPMTYFKLYSW